MIEFIHIAHAAEEAISETSGNPAATLGLNIKFFIAQLINFGILLLVFWKWILPGVTKRLQERSQKIEKSLKDADQIQKDKLEFAAWKDKEMKSARQEASAIVTSAQAEAGKVKQKVLDETKMEQEKILQQSKEQIELEKNNALQSAKAELADLVTNATEKVLRKKLDHRTDMELIKESLSSIR